MVVYGKCFLINLSSQHVFMTMKQYTSTSLSYVSQAGIGTKHDNEKSHWLLMRLLVSVQSSLSSSVPPGPSLTEEAFQALVLASFTDSDTDHKRHLRSRPSRRNDDFETIFGRRFAR